MRAFYIVLPLLISVSYVLSQEVTLDQPGSVTVKPSETMKLPCKVSVAVTSYYWGWIRQLPGKGLEYIGRIASSGTSQPGSSFNNRATFTRDTAKNEVYVQITYMRSEESGVYYCARDTGFDYWGQGTLVTVTTVPLSAPLVFPLIPCCGNVDLKTNVTIGCLATGFMPSPVEITWTGGSKISSVRSTKPVLGATDGLFTQSGQISIPASELKNNPVQCSVAHSFSGTNQKKTLRALPCTQPTVQLLLQPPCANADLFKAAVGHKNINTTLDLVCLISNFYPQNIHVQWLVNGKEDVSASATVPVPLKANDGLFTANSHLTILEGKWNKGTGYSCIVTHIASKIDTVANISKCTEPCSDSLEIYLIPPTFEDLYIKRNAKIVCFVNNMRTTENVEVIWTRENGNVTFITEDPILHDNGTYSMYSYLKICSEDWETGEKFTCTVKSQDLPSPLKKVIFKHNERTPSAPYVYILPPANEEIEQKELASITCFVSTFYPNDILIKWLDGGNEVSVDKYVNTAPIKKDDGTYVMYSYLTVSANKWKDGNVFTCVVGHEALPYYIRQQSIDKSSGKPTNVNVSLVMSETLSACH